MKKKFAVILLAAALLLCGCSKAYVYVIKELSIQIITTNGSDGFNSKTVDFVIGENNTSENKHAITSAQYKYINSVLGKIKKPDFLKHRERNYYLFSKGCEDHTYLGRIITSSVSEPAYMTFNGRKYKTSNDYNSWDMFDEYPDGFDEFLAFINAFEPDDPIKPGKSIPMSVSAELYKKITGFTDDMVTGGTIDDVLNKYPIDACRFMDQYTANSFNYNFYKNTSIKDVFQYWPLFSALPVGIKSADSTEKELQDYVQKLAAALGTDQDQIIYENSNRIIRTNAFTVHIYRSCAIPEKYQYSDTIPRHLVSHEYYDGKELDKTDKQSFFYSKDGKFLVAVDGCLESSWYGKTIAPDKLMNFYTKIKDLVE